MSALFPALCTRELCDGVRISQRLRPRQRVMYGLSATATVGGTLAYIAVSEQRRWPLELPLILLGAAFLLHVVLFAFMVYHHCVVVVRGGEVVVWKRGRPETRFAADSVQEVTAVYSDGDAWPGVHILHAAGFVVVFRGLGAFSDRRQAVKVLRYAMQGRDFGSDPDEEEEEMVQKSGWGGKGDVDAELIV